MALSNSGGMSLQPACSYLLTKPCCRLLFEIAGSPSQPQRLCPKPCRSSQFSSSAQKNLLCSSIACLEHKNMAPQWLSIESKWSHLKLYNSCLPRRSSQLFEGGDSHIFMCSLDEGRTPWKATPALPVDHIETESSVCSVSGKEGGLMLAGLDNGVISAWDSRSKQDAWQVANFSLLLKDLYLPLSRQFDSIAQLLCNTLLLCSEYCATTCLMT